MLYSTKNLAGLILIACGPHGVTGSHQQGTDLYTGQLVEGLKEHYTLGRFLGSGTSAIVYDVDPTCVAKVVTTGLGLPPDRDQLEMEHKGLAAMRAYKDCRKLPLQFLVEKLRDHEENLLPTGNIISKAPGLNLAAIIKQQPEQLEPKHILEIAAGLSLAVVLLKDKGYIYRYDLSLENVMLDIETNHVTLIDYETLMEVASLTPEDAVCHWHRVPAAISEIVRLCMEASSISKADFRQYEETIIPGSDIIRAFRMGDKVAMNTVKSLAVWYSMKPEFKDSYVREFGKGDEKSFFCDLFKSISKA